MLAPDRPQPASKVIVMYRIQRIRHFVGVLAALVGVHGVGEQVAGAAIACDRCAAERRAGKLAATSMRPCFGVAVVLAVPLFAGTAIVATSPAGNASVVMPQPPAISFGRYPSAFIEWKLSAWPLRAANDATWCGSHLLADQGVIGVGGPGALVVPG
jgi:hypothetical protein